MTSALKFVRVALGTNIHLVTETGFLTSIQFVGLHYVLFTKLHQNHLSCFQLFLNIIFHAMMCLTCTVCFRIFLNHYLWLNDYSPLLLCRLQTRCTSLCHHIGIGGSLPDTKRYLSMAIPAGPLKLSVENNEQGICLFAFSLSPHKLMTEKTAKPLSVQHFGGNPITFFLSPSRLCPLVPSLSLHPSFVTK